MSVIHLLVPDAVSPLGQIHLSPGGRREVRLRSGVVVEFAQARPGFLTSWCRACGAMLTEPAWSLALTALRHRDGCPALRGLGEFDG
jgi:hypothetical protein